MITGLTGILLEADSENAVVDVNGVNYIVFCSLKDIAILKGMISKKVSLYTLLIHKEDSMTLYGFTNKIEREGFNSLIKVNGVGPKVALRILSFYTTEEINTLVSTGEPEHFKKIPGIGLKLAQKIILDFKGVLVFKNNDKYLNDVSDALISLGFKQQDIDKLFKSEHFNKTGAIETDIKQALKLIGKI